MLDSVLFLPRLRRLPFEPTWTSTLRMKTLSSQVAELTCRWGKPCTWSVKPKMVAAVPTNVEPMSKADVRHIRKAHQVATLRAVLAAAA